MQLLARLRSLPAPRPVVADRLIVGGLILSGVAQGWPPYLPVVEALPRIDWAWYFWPVVFAVGAPLPLLFRRFHPTIVFAWTFGTALLAGTLSREVASPVFATLLAVYSVGRYTSSRDRSVAVIVTTSALVVASLVVGDGVQVWSLSLLAILVSIWLLGDAVRATEVRAERLEERAAWHEAEKRASVARAADEERSRIARELHDVIAHNVSVMVVQAAAARRVLDEDPEQARASLETIETTGREALTEMRRLLGVLRAGRKGPTDPQPSMARLATLVEEMRASGLPVELEIEGTPRELPAGVDLSAYRVVQEALTNALRHAGRTATRVVVRYDKDAIDLEIVDTGRALDGSPTAAPVTDPAATGGHGIAGMRERVALVRGELEAGPSPEGGFRVRARLPVDAA